MFVFYVFLRGSTVFHIHFPSFDGCPEVGVKDGIFRQHSPDRNPFHHYLSRNSRLVFIRITIGGRFDSDSLLKLHYNSRYTKIVVRSVFRELNDSGGSTSSQRAALFPRAGCQSIIRPKFSKHCKKIKKIGPRKGATCIQNSMQKNSV